MTEEMKAEIKNIVFDALPCATNKVCKEVNEVQTDLKDVKKILVGLLIMVISTLVAVILK
jgi:hypothetical protein